MNRGALVLLVVSLALTTHAQAENPLQISEKRLLLSIRFDNAQEASQTVKVVDGMPSILMVASPRSVQERHYIPSPAGPIPQVVTTVQESTAAIELIPRVLEDQVEVEIARQPVKRSGKLGEWFELGTIAVSAGGESRRMWVKVDERP
ncbi:MAG: hypothetical protein JO292_02465 [Betaproteobacteria bacterium]|nr:hypothetical protein [Betaproteobacteria bacterium]MBV9360231.1 hypothetical protein [Betaproteobacteria bacterium]